MFNFDYVRKNDIKEHNLNWLQISDYLYRILVVEGSEFGKTSTLLNLRNIMSQIFVKFINMLKIHIKQNINY